MPARRFKAEFQGRAVECVAVGIQHATETWNTVLLDDGTTLRLKTVMTSVARIVDPQMYDDEGNPVYLVKTANIIKADALDQMRKPEGA